MATTGDLNLTIADNVAAVSVAAANRQVVLGCSASGSTTAPTLTRNPATITSTYDYGPLSEYCGLAIQSGAEVLALRLPTTTAGAVVKKAAKSVSDATNATPIVITTSASHGLIDGDVVTVASVGGNTAANGTFKVNVLTSTTFQLVGSVGNGSYTSGGTVTPDGVIQLNSDGTYSTSTSEVTLTGTPKDTYYILITFSTGGTVGTTGIQMTISLDGGRTTNLPLISLGTATTYEIPNTGITVNLSAGTISTGTTARAYTSEPLPSIADITAALLILQNSPYAAAGWGSMVLLGAIGGTDAGTVGTNLETMASAKVYTHMMGHVRDASPPAAWGGTGETDSDWSAAVILDYFSITTRRFGVSAGHYNIRSVYPNSAAGLPLFRRPLVFAWGSRVAGQLPVPADHEGWVQLGSLSQVTQSLTTDPTDGFVYHDERITTAFDNKKGGSGRMCAARTRLAGYTGWYLSNPMLLAPVGSDFQLAPNRRVMDIASTTVQQVGTRDVFSRVKTNRNGTIREGDALFLEGEQESAIDVALAGQISGRTVVVDRDWNVKANESIKITGTIQRDAYALEINETIAFGAAAE